MSDEHRNEPESNEPESFEGAGAQLPRATIRARAVSGAAFVAGRGILLLVMAAVANAVLARELSPHAFGLVAFGFAIMTFASALADGGLGSALIRSSVAIDKATLRSVFGLELTVSLALFVLVAAVALPFFGIEGQLTAIMAASLPLAAFSTPIQIVLERNLEYKTLARVELLQALVYYAFAVTAVSLGAGVWGLASAAVLRSASSYLLLVWSRRDLFFLPLISIARLRPLLRFGLNFQAISFVNVIRDQGLNIAIAAIAGTTVLGLWTLGRRLVELPMVLFNTLWRISFPAMSQLIRAGADVRSLIERAAKLTSIGSGLVLAPFAACAPGVVPGVFGGRWHEAGVLVSLACAGLVMSGPISVATAGYLYAVGDASSVLLATVGHTAAWLVGSVVMLPWLGAVAIPLGWILGCIVDMILLARATQKHISVRLFRSTAKTTIAAMVAGALGIAVTVGFGRSLVVGAVSGLLALVLYGGALMLVEESHTSELIAAVRANMSRRAAAVAFPGT